MIGQVCQEAGRTDEEASQPSLRVIHPRRTGDPAPEPASLARQSFLEFRHEVEARLKARIQLEPGVDLTGARLPRPAGGAQLGDAAVLDVQPGTLVCSLLAPLRDLVVIPAGGQVAALDAPPLTASSGSFLLLPAGVLHRLEFREAHVLLVSADPARLARTSVEMGLADGASTVIAGRPRIGEGIGPSIDVAAIVSNQLALAGLCPGSLAGALQIDALLFRLLARGLARTQSELHREPETTGVTARVCRFVLGNLEQTFTMEDLAELCGQSVRSIQMHFQRSLGLSPMQWIQQQKLLATRRALELAGPEETVTTVALRYFGHLGNFAGRYRSTFGERPSDTIRRSPLRQPGARSPANGVASCALTLAG